MEDGLRQRLGAGLADPDLRLIETLRWDGERFPLLDQHLARLTTSAATLGWSVQSDRVRTALATAVDGAGAARARLTLGARGEPDVAATPLAPSSASWEVSLADERVSSEDPWLRFKSTRRARYDHLRATLPGGIDEVLCANERGEVTEGTITNVFFDRGDGLRTPPVESGCLPGVLRATLLAERCREDVLLVADLPRVELWVGNAVRGLIRARYRA